MESALNMFEDRAEAGRHLAERLARLGLNQPQVYALPRGGVPVAVEIARALNAPLDLVFVRKLSAPGAPEVALGAIVNGQAHETVINEDVRRSTGANKLYIDRARAHELTELNRRREAYLGTRAPLDPRGRTVIVVDDGLATGATMKAALIALKRKGAARICLAIPVAPASSLAEIRAEVDDIVCLLPVRRFLGVGAYYRDFHQLTDSETIGLLREVWDDHDTGADPPASRQVAVPPLSLPGDLRIPREPRGLVVFAHGSGSSRFSPRNRAVAEALGAQGFATLLIDLLKHGEAEDRRNVFDIPLLAERLVEIALWASAEPDIADLPLGFFGASTGAGAALLAAAELGDRVAAVVSRGGRADLAGPRLVKVEAPTLLIVGGNDSHVLDLNRKALAAMTCEKLLRTVPGAGHLFEV